MSLPWKVQVTSSREMERLGQTLGQSLRGGEVIALFGELGAGKTVLVRGLAAGLGISPDHVTSPTFTMIHEYLGRQRLAHVDLYRLDHPEDINQLGLNEYYDDHTVMVIEWADRMVAAELPPDHLSVQLEHIAPSIRHATITAFGPSSAMLLYDAQSRHGVRNRSRSRS